MKEKLTLPSFPPNSNSSNCLTTVDRNACAQAFDTHTKKGERKRQLAAASLRAMVLSGNKS